MQEDWDDLRFVLAVAEEGTVSGAARRLGVNHATVLRRVAQFEERVGTSLFDRTPRGYALPSDRLRIIEAMREVDRSVQMVGRLLSGARAPLSGEVRLTSTDSFCQILLPPMLARIGQSAPDLRATLSSSNLPVDLGRSQADVTVRPTDSLPDDLVGAKVGVLGFGLYGVGGGPDGMDRWLCLAGSLQRSVPGRWMAEMVPADRQGDGADSFLTLRELAAAGRGMAVLPCFLGDGDSRLRRVEGRMPRLAVDIWVASHADLAQVPRLARMRGLLGEAFAAEAERLAG
ncbi:MAG: LysR family transcriptional regulator [Rhodobacteraceae bacterium]|nr:LysR family transcriptional regulator [Paracoccaceae bacterium]